MEKGHRSLLIMALLLEVLQKSDKTYAIDRGFLGFCFQAQCASYTVFRHLLKKYLAIY